MTREEQIRSLIRLGLAVVAFAFASVGPMPSEELRVIVMAAALGLVILA